MRRKFEDRMDVIDAVEDVKAQISFMSEACMALCRQEETMMGEQSINGIQIIFNGINDQIEDAIQACRDGIFAVHVGGPGTIQGA